MFVTKILQIILVLLVFNDWCSSADIDSIFSNLFTKNKDPKSILDKDSIFSSLWSNKDQQLNTDKIESIFSDLRSNKDQQSNTDGIKSIFSDLSSNIDEPSNKYQIESIFSNFGSNKDQPPSGKQGTNPSVEYNRRVWQKITVVDKKIERPLNVGNERIDIVTSPSMINDDSQQTATVTTTTTATLFERQLSGNVNTNSRFSKLPSADRGECGRNSFDSSRRIVGGTSSKEGQWPWLVAIGYKTPGLQNPRTPDWMCGGALITRRYVLTAAHCVSESLLNSQPFVVQLGNIDLKNTTAGVFIEIEDTIMHDFDPKTNFNDIALFRLKKEAPLNRLIQPICLPFEDKQRSDLFLQKSPFVAGWGKIMHDGPLSPTLRHVQVNVVDNPRCKDIFASVGSVIHDISSLCAGEVTGGKDSCAGDSGGPLMLPLKNNKFYVIGVVSYGYRCAEAGFPGVHARVTNYIQWISDNIR